MKDLVRSRPCLSAWRRLRTLPRDERGTSAIEFALASLPVFFLIVATIEFALDMTVDVTVQIAAQAASRAGLTVTAPATGTREAQAQQIVMRYLGMWQNVGATVSVTEYDYSNFSNFGSSTYSPTTGAGNCGDVEMYNIQVSMPAFTGLASWFGMPNLNFQRNFIVQNEQCSS
ncbi:TadE/TadG family type IV pilus assembly protein [Paraburkholderia lycopersici]|uniref:Flp pilus assembly protein TadG n=1 Tax=Paraburkholderia lycopersici TaxID=416944 RepID=A0A1G6W0J1_9BURK|nr:TadE/TadG family type IV pilus assembly protein [Paraburkholderia lycopersici]SDD59351.1 Flp pilus assembly protein TadG [Paraburkholderia lycopersici]